MRALRIFAVCLLATVSVVSAKADTAGASLAVTGTLTGSISMVIESVTGPAVTGDGTDTVSNPLGNISKFGPVPAGVDHNALEGEWAVNFEAHVLVEKANLPGSIGFSLKARLATAAPTGVQFWVGSSPGIATFDTTIFVSGAYGVAVDGSVLIFIADSFTGGPIDNTIIYTATSH